FCCSAYAEISTGLVVDRVDEVHRNGADQRKQHIFPRNKEQRCQHDHAIEAELKPACSYPISILQIERENVDAADAGTMPEKRQHAHANKRAAHECREKRMDA